MPKEICSEIKKPEITPKKMYLNRRQFMARAASLSASALGAEALLFHDEARAGKKLSVKKKVNHSGREKVTPFKSAASYNNFYEFTTDKEGIAGLSRKFRTRPWTIKIAGHLKKSGSFDADELVSKFPLEERIYRLRCVEAWSMVIPWIGFPLRDFITVCEPTTRAKYIKFTTIHAPQQMPGLARGILDWPYVEGLRMDEAMHPLTLLAVGMYGEELPKQNGAPIRLIVPWKYGFKSIKSIARIDFVDEMPKTSWVKSNPREYGFFANVNPDVDHPRWSQARERRIGEFRKRKTIMFNGYAEQVAHMYKGMDLKKYF
jgi:sulfoxide reductase catalytic subunit YedY